MRVNISKDNPNMTYQAVPLQSESMDPPRSWSTARTQCQRDTGSATSTTISPHDTESATLDPPPRPPVRDPQTAIHGAATEALDLRGYISGLLQLYEDWHSKDTQQTAIEIQHMLLRCLHKVTHNNPGRQAFISQGGLRLLYHTSQTDLLTKGLESLIEPSVQLMRKCLPKTPLPLTSDQSAYTFLLPGRVHTVPDVDILPDNSSEESDDEDADKQQAESKDYVLCGGKEAEDLGEASTKSPAKVAMVIKKLP
ncbi:unnamed protein product [Pleuronectes platessa]|uniref:Uncharacterized protein n=1 Tax=Pleuronectes platessa TaxID=8262 RepID=A0A9N7VCD5_PLEPL|nr:unnamed protein product [Pleuronectes platessa]